MIAICTSLKEQQNYKFVIRTGLRASVLNEEQNEWKAKQEMNEK